jgi:hypothetical protein
MFDASALGSTGLYSGAPFGLLVYVRLFSAGFVEFDDDIHAYAKPSFNPLTLHNLASLAAGLRAALRSGRLPDLRRHRAFCPGPR